MLIFKPPYIDISKHIFFQALHNFWTAYVDYLNYSNTHYGACSCQSWLHKADNDAKISAYIVDPIFFTVTLNFGQVTKMILNGVS